MAYAKNIILAVMLNNKMFKNKNQTHLVSKKPKVSEKTIPGESAFGLIIFFFPENNHYIQKNQLAAFSF